MDEIGRIAGGMPEDPNAPMGDYGAGVPGGDTQAALDGIYAEGGRVSWQTLNEIAGQQLEWEEVNKFAWAHNYELEQYKSDIFYLIKPGETEEPEEAGYEGEDPAAPDLGPPGPVTLRRSAPVGPGPAEGY